MTTYSILIDDSADEKAVTKTRNITKRIDARIHDLTDGREDERARLENKVTESKEAISREISAMAQAEKDGDYTAYKAAEERKTSAEWASRAAEKRLRDFDHEELASAKEDEKTVSQLNDEIRDIDVWMDAEIRKHTDAIKEIIATGFTREQDASETLAAWCTDVMHKPVPYKFFGTQLSRKLNMILNGSRW